MNAQYRLISGLLIGSFVALASTPAAADRVNVEPGDHFSKTYYVDATGIPYHYSDDVSFTWTVKRKHRIVRTTSEDGWFLRPGKYVFTYRATAKNPPAATATLNTWGWSPCTFTIHSQTTTATTTTEIQSYAGISPRATYLRYFTPYFRDYANPGRFYYGNRFGQRVEFTSAGANEISLSQLPEKGRELISSNRAGLMWAEDGVMVVQSYPDLWQTRTTNGSVTCVTSTESTYTADFSIPQQVAYTSPIAFHMTSVPLDTVLHLSAWKDVLASGSIVKRVRAVNGADVTRREANAVRIHMPMSRVHRIFGTSGVRHMRAEGFETREYDDWVFIGYVNGRVNSIQTYP